MFSKGTSPVSRPGSVFGRGNSPMSRMGSVFGRGIQNNRVTSNFGRGVKY